MKIRLTFFLLGVSSLLLEIFFLKKSLILLGSTYQASGLVLFAYFLGVAAGNLIFSRIINLKRSWFLGLAASLILSFLVFHSGMSLPRGLFLFLAVFPSCFFLGAFFPLAGRLVGGQETTRLYGLNALGSVLGVILGAFFLPPVLGYDSLFYAGAALLAVCFILLQQFTFNPANGTSSPFLLLSFFSGFLTILLETVWIRQASIGTDSTVYAFGSVTLLFIAFSAIAAFLVKALPERFLRMEVFLVLSGIGILACSHLFSSATGGLKTIVIDRTSGFPDALLFSLRFLPAGMLFPLFVFPILIRQSRGGLGMLFAVNGLGCALGSLCGGFVFPKVIGMWGMAFLCACAYPLLIEKTKAGLALSGGAVLLALVFSPMKLPRVTPDPLSAGFEAPAALLSADEGPYGIVSVIDFNKRKTLWLNSSYVLGGVKDPTDDRRMGLLPVILNPGAKSAAYIGMATGISASGLLKSNLEKITLVELVPEVSEAARKYFSDKNAGLFRDKRVRVVVDDGRHFMAASRDTFDLVVSDLFVPWHEGSSFLYTKEHFENVKRRLALGGLFIQWLPLYELTMDEFLIIARTFYAVFPEATLWQNTFSPYAPVIALIGGSRLVTEKINRAITERAGAAGPDYIEKDPAGLYSRYLGPLASLEPDMAIRPLNTLDRPVIEFMAAEKGRVFMTGSRFLSLEQAMLTKPPDRGNACFTDFTPDMRKAREAGFCMTHSVYFLTQGDREHAYKLFDRYKSLMPAVLHMP